MTHPDPSKLGDRELDALVAEKVMGYKKSDTPSDFRQQWEMPSRHPDPKHRKEYPYWYDSFEPSTDISAAWQVVEKMRGEDGDALGFKLTDENLGPWTATFVEYQPQDDGPAFIEPVKFCADGPTPSRAICLAALRATGDK